QLDDLEAAGRRLRSSHDGLPAAAARKVRSAPPPRSLVRGLPERRFLAGGLVGDGLLRRRRPLGADLLRGRRLLGDRLLWRRARLRRALRGSRLFGGGGLLAARPGFAAAADLVGQGAGARDHDVGLDLVEQLLADAVDQHEVLGRLEETVLTAVLDDAVGDRRA